MGDNNLPDGTNDSVFGEVTLTSVSKDTANFIDTLKSNLESSNYSEAVIRESISRIQHEIKSQLLQLSKITEATEFTVSAISLFDIDGKLKVNINNGVLPQISEPMRVRKCLLNNELGIMSLDWDILPNVNEYSCNIYYLNLLGYNLKNYLITSKT